jgi:dolichyl-diphosphooligosaccharide--protein glycosyltransferase
MAALGIFGLLQIVAFFEFLRFHLSAKEFNVVLNVGIIGIFFLGLTALFALVSAGYIAPFTGRFYSLWDTGYAKIHIPIIASVSEHQPTAWPSFFFDLGLLMPLLPVGMYYCFSVSQSMFSFLYRNCAMSICLSSSMPPLPLTLLVSWFVSC